MPVHHPVNSDPPCPQPRNSQGWTLVEMLITLAVMGVLAALALPTYQQQQRQTRRSDGQAALLQLQTDQARWRSTHSSHAESLSALGWTSDRSPLGHYRITGLRAFAFALPRQRQRCFRRRRTPGP